jgi:hypothetical protein
MLLLRALSELLICLGWLRKEYSCDGVKTLVQVWKDGTGQLQRDLASSLAFSIERNRYDGNPFPLLS